MWNTLLLEKKDATAIIRLNRPEVLNALNGELLGALAECLRELEKDEAVAVIVVTGAGERSFAAGADISEMQNLAPARALDWARFGQRVFDRLEAMPQPVIAAVNGFALGGGNELAMACDFRLASEKAKFGQPEPGLGVTPGFGGTQRLPRLISRGRAAYMLYSGEIIDAKIALDWGLVDMLCPPEHLLPKAMEIAKKIAGHSRHAIRQIKHCLRRGLESHLRAGQELEAQAFGLCFSTEEQKKRMRAFLEKAK